MFLSSVILYTGLLYGKSLTSLLLTLSSTSSLIIYSLFILSLYLKVEALDFLSLLLFVTLVRLVLIIFVIFFTFILLIFKASFFAVFPEYNLIIL
jgi:hypothetical protein